MEPQRIVLLAGDLMVAARIDSQARPLGYRVVEAADAASFAAALRADAPALGIVNLAARGVPALDAIRRAKADPATAGIPLLAFGPHVDAAALAEARRAGADLAVANSRLARDLPALIRDLTS